MRVCLYVLMVKVLGYRDEDQNLTNHSTTQNNTHFVFLILLYLACK